MPLGCAVHYSAFTAQHKVHPGMGQMFTFALEYRASKNVTPAAKLTTLSGDNICWQQQ